MPWPRRSSGMGRPGTEAGAGCDGLSAPAHLLKRASRAILALMRGTHHTLALGAAVCFGLLASSCMTVAHSTADRPTYLAQSVTVDCRPGDSSLVCCIKKFPGTPMESCGATALEVAEALNGVKVLNEASQPAGDEAAGADGGKDAAAEDDDPDDGWRQHCKDTYVACKDQKDWVGDCYACFRYCEGQRQWPFHLCTRKGKVR